MSNRFDFLKPQGSGDDGGAQPTDTAPVQMPTSQLVAIPGLEPKPDEEVVLERLNVEIPADLHQQLGCDRNLM